MRGGAAWAGAGGGRGEGGRGATSSIGCRMVASSHLFELVQCLCSDTTLPYFLPQPTHWKSAASSTAAGCIKSSTHTAARKSMAM